MIRRRRLKSELFCVVLFTIFSGGYLYSRIKSRKPDNDALSYNLPKKSLLSVKYTFNNSTTEVWKPSASIRRKHTTKSMSELGKMDEINPHFLLLNWIAGSGAEMLVFLLEKNQGINSFKHVRLKESRNKILTILEQKNVIEQMDAIRRNMAVPLSFDRNNYFINFSYFEKQSPTYLNLVRDPVMKMVKQTMRRKADSDFSTCMLDNKRNCTFEPNVDDLIIPWFCGHDPRCVVNNNKWALETAKQNVERFYPVVGVLEDFDVTLRLLEKKLPQFFRGAEEIFKNTLFDIFKRKKDPAFSDNVRKTLEGSLKTEINFYKWIKQRLADQAALL